MTVTLHMYYRIQIYVDFLKDIVPQNTLKLLKTL